MLRWISLGLCIALAFGDGHYHGTTVGELSQLDHLVQGTVHILDDRRILVENFHFDGLPPSTFFIVGRTTVPSEADVVLPHPGGRITKLGEISGEDIILHLPFDSDIMMSEVRILTVWCRTAFADFGSIEFPAGLAIPAPVELGDFQAVAHDVQGRVTIINHKQFRVENFDYDGTAPDVTFYVGTSDNVDASGVVIPDATGSVENLRAHMHETFVITVPDSVDLLAIRWISVWCDEFSVSFGHVMIPENILPPVYAMDVLGADMGPLSELGHAVSGHVYIVDNTHIRIYNLNYDGTAPDTHYYIGWEGIAEAGVVDNRGMILEANGLDENDEPIPLGELINVDVILPLPTGKTINDILWVSIWCEQANADFGNVLFPVTTDEEFAVLPMTHNSDPAMYTNGAHAVTSGTITFLNERQVRIEDFNYDGTAPDTFFWVGTGSTPDTNGIIIPNEMGSFEVLQAYSMVTITLTLPEGLSWYDFDYISLWCRQAVESFNHVMIPSNVFYVPYIEGFDPTDITSCMTLREDFFNVVWYVMDEYLYVKMQGVLDGPTGYMAFGFSRMADRSSMAGADAVVAHVLNGQPTVVDMHLTAYAQCVNGQGACPDEGDLGGTNNAEFLEHNENNGVTTIKYRRALDTGDENDVVFDPDAEETYIVWGMGRMQPNGLVSKHDYVLTESTLLMDQGTCAPVRVDDNMQNDGWEQEMVPAGTTEFTAYIGPSGGEVGYRAITGMQSWGIAWYINGYLIPKIYMRRGDTFKFKVNGGDDPAISANYHPLYLTTSPIGGYITLTDAERADMDEDILAGVSGSMQPTAVGPLCEYETTDRSERPETYDSFEEYKDTLDLNCLDTGYGELEFTPNEDTPDVIYYQCFTHRSLGWEIHVVDNYPGVDSATDARPTFALVSLFTALSLALAKLLL